MLLLFNTVKKVYGIGPLMEDKDMSSFSIPSPVKTTTLVLGYFVNLSFCQIAIWPTKS